MIENMVKAVECFCGKPHVMTAACDPEPSDDWEYAISIESPEGMDFCCLLMNGRGVSNVIDACDLFNKATGQKIVLCLRLPDELMTFMGLSDE